MKQLVILGSTGSIGQNTLKVVEDLSCRFKVIGLAAQGKIEVLKQQIEHFLPEAVAVADVAKAKLLSQLLPAGKTKILCGSQGVEELCSLKNADLVVVAIAGKEALLPTLKAIEHKKNIALASKEVLVMAGSIVMQKARENQVKLLPLDSEESAIFQCLNQEDKPALSRIYLTASGGPLLHLEKEKFSHLTAQEVINHPKWRMGKKISVDSATLMNKGLEIIETRWLFEVNPKFISVLIHPEAIIHSMVEFVDGSVLAQLGPTDMRLPIQYALTYPERLESRLKKLNFSLLGSLSFLPPDLEKFPCLRIAQGVAEVDGTLSAVMNAVNEECVQAFLAGKIAFNDIARIIDQVLLKHKNQLHPTLAEILQIDEEARCQAKEKMTKVLV
jgi:1-deoxy-D-xylulose-5-phosphate reductoisomerase